MTVNPVNPLLVLCSGKKFLRLLRYGDGSLQTVPLTAKRDIQVLFYLFSISLRLSLSLSVFMCVCARVILCPLVLSGIRARVHSRVCEREFYCLSHACSLTQTYNDHAWLSESTFAVCTDAGEIAIYRDTELVGCFDSVFQHKPAVFCLRTTLKVRIQTTHSTHTLSQRFTLLSGFCCL